MKFFHIVKQYSIQSATNALILQEPVSSVNLQFFGITIITVWNSLHGSVCFHMLLFFFLKLPLYHDLLVKKKKNLFFFPQQLFREVRIMKILNHPNIGKNVYLLCVFNNFAFVMHPLKVGHN